MNKHPGIKQLKPSARFPRGGWQVRYRDDEGKTNRRTFPTLEEARDFQSTTRTDIRRGDYIDPRRGSTPFRKVAEDWYGTTADLKPKTRTGYRYILDAHIMPNLGDKPIGKITPAVLRGFLAGLGDREANTKRNVFRVLSPIFRQAVDDGMIRSNPVRTIRLPRASRQAMNVLTAEQVKALAETIEPEYRTLVYFAAYTGARAGEIGALRVRHLSLMDLNRARVTVEESIADVSGTLHFGPPKNGRARTFGIPRFLAEQLVEQTAGKGPDEFVFPGVKGGPLRHSHFYARQFKPAIQRAGLPDKIRFHDLRHTHASLLIAANVHPKAISERLGHSDIGVTMNIYGHLYRDHEVQMLTDLGTMFTEAKSSEPAEVMAGRFG